MVEFGAHLPLADLGDGFSLPAMRDYARAAVELGYSYLCANDHLVFARPWLDGLSALAAVVDVSGDLRLATSVALPVIRGPAALAKALTAIDVLSGGRVIAGVGPGSSRADYALAGIPFEDRWRRFDGALGQLRSLLRPDGDEPALSPSSPQPAGPPLWVASWGSPAGLRRAARLGDGWIASAYNVSPDAFRERLATLRGNVPAGRPPLPNALATTWTFVSDDRAAAQRVLTDVLAPMVNRPVESLRGLPIGPAEVCAQRLAAFADAGVERVFLWPLADPVSQLETLRDRVFPLVTQTRRS
jgi:alkanesulfonate monooxygenase SsuD/methylene tetrahydromethanopterin reductase-like flavin-dependent oxidoreductase (luciferase family)